MMKIKLSGCVVIFVPVVDMVSDEHTKTTDIAIGGNGDVQIANFLTVIHDVNNIPDLKQMDTIKKLVTHMILNRAAEVYDPGADIANQTPLSHEEIKRLLGGGGVA